MYGLVSFSGKKNFQKLNPVEVSFESNKLVNELFRYKKNYKYKLIVTNSLFSSSIANKNQVIFISCDGLKSTIKNHL